MKAIRSGNALLRVGMGYACLGATALLGGCFRRQAPPTVPAVILAPEKMPIIPAFPAMVYSLPDVGAALPVKVTELRPRRILRRSSSRNSAAETTTSVDPAVAEGASIGELSAGGDSNPQTQQDAKALIDESEHRLNSFSPSAGHQLQAQLRKVRYFLKQARQALNSGDAEGARTLATKAKLLLDDVAK